MNPISDLTDFSYDFQDLILFESKKITLNILERPSGKLNIR
jgi:hypothetical protein